MSRSTDVDPISHLKDVGLLRGGEAVETKTKTMQQAGLHRFKPSSIWFPNQGTLSLLKRKLVSGGLTEGWRKNSPDEGMHQPESVGWRWMGPGSYRATGLSRATMQISFPHHLMGASHVPAPSTFASEFHFDFTNTKPLWRGRVKTNLLSQWIHWGSPRWTYCENFNLSI